MLLPSDNELAQRDFVLRRGLTLLLDEEAFADALRQRLGEVTVTSARALYVRYKPRTNCLVAYRLNSEGLEVDVYAKAFCKDDRAKFELTERQRKLNGLFGPGYLALEEEAVVVSFFPNDAKLKALKRIAPNNIDSNLLRKLFPHGRDFWDGPVKVLRYKPERRFVGRIASRTGGSAAVLKLYAGDAWNAACANAQAFKSHGVLRVARPVGAYAPHGVLALEWLDGTPVDALLTGPDSYDVVTRVGEALGELHAQETTGLPRLLPGSEIQSLQGMAMGLEHIAAPEGARAASLAREIAHRWSRCETVAKSIHGDFYSGQVLSSNGRISILDLDEAALGNPLTDLGNFLAHLERESLELEAGSSRLKEIELALLEGYTRDTGQRVHRSSLAAFTAASLIKLAHHPFRLREPNWRSRTTAIIERAEQILACDSHLSKPKSIASTQAVRSKTRASDVRSDVIVLDPTSAVSDVALPFLRNALDPVQASRRLQRCLADSDCFEGKIELQGIRVIRHKRARRCVIEYDLTLTRPGGLEEQLTLVGKARARGLDERCFRLQVALRQSGFDESSSDGISVPEPVAMVPEFNMCLQRKAPGELASKVLGESQEPQLAIRIAESIHKLQNAGVEPERHHTIQDELLVLDSRLTSLACARPEWRGRLERVSNACRRLGEQLSGRRLRPAHRDFYPDQILVDGERLYLLDFDLYASANPVLDAGNFIAHLIEQSLRQTGGPGALAHHEQTIAEFCVGSDMAKRVALDHYVTLALVRHIHISTCIPERRCYTESILQICERRLDISRQLTQRYLQMERINYANANV